MTAETTTTQRVARLLAPMVLVAVLALLALSYLRPIDAESIPPPPPWRRLGIVIVAILPVISSANTKRGAIYKIVGAILALLLALFATIDWQEW